MVIMDKGSDEPPDFQQKLEEEIKKPYYGINYLSNFKLPYDKLNVSVIIPTYNRCPHDPKDIKKNLNPLAWTIKSVLLQKPSINEIIIIDDNSDDYTFKVIKSFKKEAKEKGIKIVYIKNSKKIGIGCSRNIACKNTNSKYLFFADDDLIMTPHAIFGAVHTFELISKKEDKIAMVGLPIYFRQSFPTESIPKSEIGNLNFTKGIITTNKDLFPQEQLEEENKDKKFIDNELQILEPIKIQNANAYCLCSKKAFEEAGGFQETIIRGEDREFGCRLIENGYSLYFSPDIKFHSVHGMFGFNSKKKFKGEDWFKEVGGMITLKKAMEECDKPNTKTGMRVSIKKYIYEQILSFFCLTYRRSQNGSIKWIKKVYEEFVRKGEVKGMFGNRDIPIPSENEREKMWISAINRGVKIIEKEEQKGTKRLNKTIKELLQKNKIDENIINVLETRIETK